VNIQPIDPLGLTIAAGFITLIALLSRLLKLGLVKTLLVAAARTYVQLMILGYVLVFIFAWDHPLITGVVFGVMMFFSAHTIGCRLKNLQVPVTRPILIAVFGGGCLVTLLVTLVVLRLEPFYQARYWLPIGGMVLGNSMNGIALSVERLFADLKQRRAQVNAMIALGADTQEAGAESLRAALRAGLIPTINNMAAVGVVSIPGMMTGQILAGADPQQAARYQIVVMVMIAASTALGAITAVVLCSRRAFSDDGALL